jgi:hypothetical protein
MAMLTVGAGALLIGMQIIGLPAAIRVDVLLLVLGTISGLACSVVIPYLMFTHHELRVQDTVGSWLMAIVPPMVSAATGAALIAHLPAGSDRLTLLLLCYSMFGLSLFMAMIMIVIVLIWARLAYHAYRPHRRSRHSGSCSGRWANRSPRPRCSATPRPGSQRRRTPPRCTRSDRLRHPDLGFRGRVDGDRRGDHDPHRTSAATVLAGVVELHLPRRHRRDRNRRARNPQPRSVLHWHCTRALRAARGGLADRSLPHRTRDLHRPAPAPTTQQLNNAAEGEIRTAVAASSADLDDPAPMVSSKR